MVTKTLAVLSHWFPAQLLYHYVLHVNPYSYIILLHKECLRIIEFHVLKRQKMLGINMNEERPLITGEPL